MRHDFAFHRLVAGASAHRAPSDGRAFTLRKTGPNDPSPVGGARLSQSLNGAGPLNMTLQGTLVDDAGESVELKVSF